MIASVWMQQEALSLVLYLDSPNGSKISFMGIPTPNLFAGGENMHGRFEYVSLETMERAVDTIIGIVSYQE